MKKLCVLIFLFLFTTLLSSQENYHYTPFSELEFSVMGGLNSETGSQITGGGQFEFKTGIFPQAKLLFSIGLYNVLEAVNIPGKAYYYRKGNNLDAYFSADFVIQNYDYVFIPASLGMQYIITENDLQPYVFGVVSYNKVNATKEYSKYIEEEYDSFEEVPVEFRQKFDSGIPGNSFAFGIGAGVTYEVIKPFSLDLRYHFNYDSETINTHRFLIGIVI